MNYPALSFKSVGAKEASAQEQDDGVEGEAGTVETQEIHPGEDQLIGVPVEALDQIDDIRVPHVCEEFPHIVIEDRHDEHLQEEFQQADDLVFADMQVAKEAEDQDPEIEMSDKRYKVNTEASTVPALVLSNIRISGNDEGTAHGVGDGDSDYHHHPSEAVGLQSTGPQHDSRIEQHQVRYHGHLVRRKLGVVRQSVPCEHLSPILGMDALGLMCFTLSTVDQEVGQGFSGLRKNLQESV